MWWNDGNGTWFCQAPRKAPCSTAAWPATAAATAGHSSSALEHRGPPPARPTYPHLNLQRAGGRESRRLQTRGETEMAKRTGAKLRSVSTSPSQEMPLPPKSSQDANHGGTAGFKFPFKENEYPKAYSLLPQGESPPLVISPGGNQPREESCCL